MRRMALETPRLVLRKLTTDDAAFMLDLLNQPSFHQYIGDRGVRSLEAAAAYIERGAMASYERHGFGLYAVEVKGEAGPVGICGLVKRDGLDDVDIGFAFVPSAWSVGYATESAMAVLDEGLTRFGLTRIVAITAPDNDRSIRVLEKLGFAFESMVCLAPETSELRLFAWQPRHDG